MKKVIDVVKKTLKVFSENEMSVYSGYASLYILTAFIPLLILIITAVNMLPGYDVTDFLDFIFEHIPDIPQVRKMLEEMIWNLNKQSGGLVASVSALTTLWSASNGVSAIQASLQRLEGMARSNLRGKPSALVFTVIYILLIPSMLIFQVLGDSLQNLIRSAADILPLTLNADTLVSIVKVSGLVILAVMLFVIVLTYAYLPKGMRPLKTRLPGAVFTSVCWVVFSKAFAYFIPRFWNSSLYGSLAAVFLSIMWLKVIVTILFYGGALNEALLAEENPESSETLQG